GFSSRDPDQRVDPRLRPENRGGVRGHDVPRPMDAEHHRHLYVLTAERAARAGQVTPAEYWPSYVIGLMLVLARTGGVFVSSPVLSSKAIPPTIKVALAVTLTI